MKIRISRMREDAVIPEFQSQGAAGCDLRACTDADTTSIAPGQTVLIGTGLAAAIPEGYFGAVFARSGLALKEGLRRRTAWA